MNVPDIENRSKIPQTLCIMLFVVLFFVNTDFGIGYIYNYLFVSVFIILGIFIDQKIYITKEVIVYFVLSLFVVIFSFLPNSVKDPESTNHAISLVMFFVCCVISLPSEREYSYTKRLLIFVALVVSAYTFFVKAAPDIYWDIIFPHLSEYTQASAVELMKNYSYGVPIGGTVIYANYILALSLITCMGEVFGESSMTVKKRILLILASGVFITAMGIQNRRGESMATVIALVFMFLVSTYLRYGIIRMKRLKQVSGIIILGVIGITILYSVGIFDRIVETFVQLGQGSSSGIETAGNGRMELWREALIQFGKSPLLGIGWNRFRDAFSYNGAKKINVHNDYLQLLCETGMVGFALIVIPIVYLWFKTFQRCCVLFDDKVCGYEREKRYALVAYGIQNFFIVLHFIDPCLYKLLFWPIYAYSIILYRMSLDDYAVTGMCGQIGDKGKEICSWQE